MSLVSLYDAASLWMTPSGAEDGKLFSELPVPVYGPELVTNGGFDTDSDWALTQATISNGKLLLSTSDGSYTAASQTLGVIGKTYRVSLDVADIVGIISITIGGGTDFDITSNGIHSFEITSTTTTLEVKRKFGITNVSATIDNVSVKEVLKPSGDFTFSRGSNLAATRVDVNGLIEKGRENLFTYSQDFRDAGGWLVSNATKGSITETDPNGGSTAANITWTSGSDRYFYKNITSGNILTTSFYVKSNGGGNKFRLFGDGANDLSQDFTATSEWQRFEFFFERGSGQGVGITNASDNSAADLLVAFAQLEQGLVATDYIETGTSAAQSGILEDMPRLDYSGGASCPSLLLEPQRTNFVKSSEYFNSSEWSIIGSTIVDNDSISPQGVRNAARWTSNASSTHIQDSVYVDDPSSFSVFLKYVDHPYIQLYSGASGGFYANFDIENNEIGNSGSLTTNEKIEPYGDGWYRISCNFSGVAAGSSVRIGFAQSLTSNWGGLNTSAAGDVLIYGAQLETGSYPTSYIPTYGSSVTRSQDLTTADTSSFYTDSLRGTLFTELSFPLAADGNYNGWFFWNGSGYHRIVLQRRGDTGRGQIEVRINNTTQASVISPSVITLEDNHKMLVRWDGNVFTLFIDGVNIGSDTSTDTYSGTDLNELTSRPTYNAANIKQALLFPTALSDADCITLTTL